MIIFTALELGVGAFEVSLVLLSAGSAIPDRHVLLDVLALKGFSSSASLLRSEAVLNIPLVLVALVFLLVLLREVGIFSLPVDDGACDKLLEKEFFLHESLGCLQVL